MNITGHRVHTAGEFPGAYKYGAWGRDPKPEAGKESWHWLVMLTGGDKFSNYVRLYSSLSSLIVGVSKPGKQLLSGNVTIDCNTLSVFDNSHPGQQCVFLIVLTQQWSSIIRRSIDLIWILLCTEITETLT